MKNLAVFINRDFEIRDLKFIIKQFLAEGHKVNLYYSTETKNKDGYKYTGIDKLYSELSKNINFKKKKFSFKKTYFLDLLRYVNSYNSYLNREKVFKKLEIRFSENRPQVGFYLRSFRFLLKTKIIRSLFRKLLSHIENSSYNSEIERNLIEDKIDKIILTPLLLDVNLKQNEILVCAKKLNIKTIYLVRSWDNLTNKSTMNVEPDLICVWNEFQVKELKEIQKINSAKVIITGAHLYEYLIDYEEKNLSYLKIKKKNDKKTITYLGSSPQIVEDEFNFILSFLEELTQIGFDFLSNDFILRPHPLNLTKKLIKNPRLIEEFKVNLDKYKVKIFPDIDPNNLKKFYEDILDKNIYISTFEKSNLLLGVNTSAMIEANYFNKKVLQIPNIFEKKFKGLFNDTYHSKYLDNNQTINSVVRCIDLLDLKIKIEEILNQNQYQNEIDQNFKDNFLNLKERPSKKISRLI